MLIVQDLIPIPITYPTTKLQNNNTNNNSSISIARQKIQPPLPASLTTTLHRPLLHISSSNCNFKTSHPNLVLIFLSPAASRSIRVAG